jgi:hypothetical protein
VNASALPVRALRAAWCWLVLAVAGASGCAGGTPPADLFVVQRTGTIPGARLSLLVREDGSLRCNGTDPGRRLADDQILEARTLARELDEAARDRVALAAGPRSILTYRVRTQEGVVRFSDTSPGQRQAFFELAQLVRRAAQDACRLPR